MDQMTPVDDLRRLERQRIARWVWVTQNRITDFDGQATVDWVTDDLMKLMEPMFDRLAAAESRDLIAQIEAMPDPEFMGLEHRELADERRRFVEEELPGLLARALVAYGLLNDEREAFSEAVRIVDLMEQPR